MIRNSMRSTRLLSWRTIRWAIALPSVPMFLWACTSHPLTQPTPAPEQQTDIYINVSPIRQLDLLFMIDNSPSMAPKQEKLKAQFPKLITALEDPANNNALPDLRVAIIDSDLGTNGAWNSGNGCSPNAANGNNPLGDQGKFLMPGATSCGVTDSNALWLEYTSGAPVNFTGNISTVFACIAGGLGTLGCGEEHQIQAFEFALAVSNINNDTAQHSFIRSGAYLGLVFLSDEDDCSAYPNDTMFGDKNALTGESASLRCSTRAYACGGQNLSNVPPGPGYPASTSFTTANMSDCAARTDFCTTDLSTSVNADGPTDCTPLADYTRIAQEIKNLKGGDEDQILVAGIFGTALSDSSHESVKFAPRPNPNTSDTAHTTVYDYWAYCYDPDHRPTTATTDSATGFDSTAMGYGAGPGVRETAFLAQFKNNLAFSICERDYSSAMKLIGSTLAAKLQNLCVPYKLYDKDSDPSNGVQPDCRVVYRYPTTTTNADGTTTTTYKEDSTSLPECADGDTSATIQTDCWELTSDKTKCPDAPNNQLITVLRTAAEIAAGPLAAGTKVGMQCRTCTDFEFPDPNSAEALACNY